MTELSIQVSDRGTTCTCTSRCTHLPEDPGVEELLQLLIAVVDTELLKAVDLEVL